MKSTVMRRREGGKGGRKEGKKEGKGEIENMSRLITTNEVESIILKSPSQPEKLRRHGL